MVSFLQLKAACPMSHALVDIQLAALSMGKGLKKSCLIHIVGNVMQQHPAPKRKLILNIVSNVSMRQASSTYYIVENFIDLYSLYGRTGIRGE